MKKGFTLIELLGVITILGLLTLIAVPTIEKNIKDGKQKLYNVQISNIESGLKNWATDNLFYLPDDEDGVVTITLYQLKQGGYVDKDITNPLNDQLFPNDMLLTITRKNKAFEYVALTNTGTPTNTATVNPDTPSLLLNGGPIQYVEVFDTYIDPGVTALDKDGSIISSSNITITISGSGSEINTTTLGSYTVKYQVTDPSNGYKATVARTVEVSDRIKPNLVIPGNITLTPIEVLTFNARTGASATDNLDGTLTPAIEITGNLSILPGSYYLTYKVTDSSGNIATGKRKIIVEGNNPTEYAIYENGTPIYFNPVSGNKCTDGESGCMKWYAFNDVKTSQTVNLILDHNTTALVAWNSSGSSLDGPTNVFTQLGSDTSSWTGVPIRSDSYTYTDGTISYTIDYTNYRARLITADEIADITNASSDETIKWSSIKQYGTSIDIQSSWFYLDGKKNSDKTSYNSTNGWQKQYATTTGASNYAWLFDYTYSCTSYGCNIADDSNYGYWTSTAVSGISSSAWSVNRSGSLGYDIVRYDDLDGVRPVITISKSILK